MRNAEHYPDPTAGQALRAVIKYPGAKWRLADWIIKHMPRHKSYLEPYFGSGAVFFRKPPSRIETINDIDDNIYNLFCCIRDNADKLARLVAQTPYSRREYETTFTAGDVERFEQARRYLVKCWQGHGFRITCKSGWKNDINGRERAYAVRCWQQLPDWIMQIVARLKQAQIEHMPAVELIQRFNRPDVLVYADPPYLLQTRKLKKQYAHEMSEKDHTELLEVLQQNKGPVLLSGYDSELYNNMLADWDRVQIRTTAEKGLHRTEVLWIKGNSNDLRLFD